MSQILTCKICGGRNGNRPFKAREMMFGFRDEFDYFECASCGCLQIAEVPSNLPKYYPKEYGAHQRWKFEGVVGSKTFPKRFLRETLYEYHLGKKTLLGALLAKKFRSKAFPYWIAAQPMHLTLSSKILEVGSGGGARLLTLREYGFRHLEGIDPFIAADMAYDEAVRIRKTSLQEFDGQFDFIMLHHSFEHMPEPQAVFKKLATLIKPEHFLLVRVPVGGCFAWKKYGRDWVQLDAPRHLYLHTEKSLRLLAEAAGFELVKTVYDSDGFQIWGSEQYLMNIPLNDPRSGFHKHKSEQVLFNQAQLAQFERQAVELNEKKEGDQACFYFVKKKTPTP